MPRLGPDEIVARAREVAEGVVATDAAVVDREGRWPEAGLRALQAAGLGGLVVPEASGGLGQGLHTLARVCEMLGQHCGSTALCYGMHCVGAAVIAAKATLLQQRQYLEPISQGQHLTTLALSEPGTGVHLYVPQTQLEAVASGGFRLTGTKSFITNGGYADSYVVSAVAAEPDAPPGAFSCVVVPATCEGLVWHGPWEGLGLRGNSSRTADLHGVVVPRSDLLGEEGDQIWYVFEVVVPYFLVAMAGTYLGIATAAWQEARAYINTRHYAYRGGSLSHVSIVQHRLGILWAQVERTRQLIYYAAAQGDCNGTDALLALFSAKAEVAECVVQVANEAMTLTGGYGYRGGSPLERYLRDARAAHVMSPSTDLLRTWTGRALLGLPLLAD